MIDKNTKLKKDVNCDVSDEIIDFSLKNHMSEVFSDFVEHSMKSTCKRAARSIFMLLIGGGIGIAISMLVFIGFIKVFGIKNTWLHTSVKSYVSKFVNDKQLKVGSTELSFVNGDFSIALKDVQAKNLKIPAINIVPAFVKSIFSRKLHIKSMEFCNTNLELAVSNKTGSIFIKNYFEEGGADKLKYIPINKIGGFTPDNINYRLKDSNVSIRKGYDKFDLQGINGEIDGRNFRIKNAAFWSLIGKDKISFRVNNIDDKNYIGVSFNNARSNELVRFIREKKINLLMPLGSFVATCNDSELTGSLDIVLNYDNSVKSGSFRMNAKNGILPQKNTSFEQSIRHVKSAEAIGTFDNDSLYLRSLYANFGNNHASISGITLKNGNIVRMDGTLELTNVTKAELTLLPLPIRNACYTLFRNNISNFQLSSLKMDLRSVDKNSSVPDYIITHGKFEMKDGNLPLANKILNNVSASGEIIDGTIQLTLRSAKLDNMKISGGVIKIKDFENEWSGTINTVLTTEAFINQLNIFKKCSIPFDKFLLTDNVNCTLSIVSDTREKNRGFKIISGQGILSSGKHQLEVKWDKNNAYIFGIAETKAGRSVNLNINMDLQNDTGEKHLVIDSDNEVTASVNEIIAATLNGTYKIDLFEKWNGARGIYNIHADLNGSMLNLPVFGNIKQKNQPGTITAAATIDGDIMTFKSVNIDSNDKHIQGNMVVNRVTNEIIACDFADKSDRENDSSLTIKRSDNNGVRINIIGNYLDVSSIWKIVNNIKDREFEISMRIDQAKINDTRSVRHLKGRVNVKNGNIIGGALCCSLLDGSSVIVDASLADSNSSVININASNAGQFFKDLNMTNTIIGGKLKVSIVSDLSSTSNVRAINCELSDVLVKDNAMLAKIASLSTPSNIDIKNFSLGFNGIVCSMTMKGDDIEITDGKAIGPMLCLSFSGRYNRQDDELRLNGIAVPVNGYTTMGGQVTYSPYSVAGGLFSNTGLEVSVEPMVMTNHNILRGLFGMKMNNSRGDSWPTLDQPFLGGNQMIMPEIKPISVAPTASVQPAQQLPTVERGEKYNKRPIDLDKPQKPAQQSAPAPAKKKKKVVSKDAELGITITRGA